jgi:undecaprenyl-diphosphatase
VGVAQEDPARGAALVPVAGGVALGRLRAGPDAARPVVAGVLAGAAVAVATRRLWKVAPAQPATAPRVWPVVAGAPEPEGDGLFVVVNPSSGPAWTTSPTEELRSRLPRAEVHELSPDDDLVDLLHRAESRGARALGVAGGDGTVCAGVEAALRADIPLLVVPAGTLNHFARDLGVETVADAVQAVQAGELIAIDVGTIDGRPFVNTASFGSYAALVDAREQLEDRVGKWPAVLLALSKVLWRGGPAEVEIDGEPAKVWMIFIGNCCYQPEGLAPSWRERLDDGRLDVRLVDGSSPFSRTRLLLAALTGRLTRTPVYRRRVVESLRIRSVEGPLRLARDGETFDGGADVVVAKQPGRLRVFRPATSA